MTIRVAVLVGAAALGLASCASSPASTLAEPPRAAPPRAGEAKRDFAGVTPDAVAPVDRAAYLEYLERAPGGEPRSAAELASSRVAERILFGLRLRELASADPSLVGRIDRWLLRERQWFVSTYRNKAAFVREVPAGSLFRRAEEAYGRYLVSAHPNAADEDKLQIERALFVRSSHTEALAQGASYPPFAWPGVDRFAFGLGVVDAWRASGHPTPTSKPYVSDWQAFIACPRNRWDARRPAGCDDDWYRFALETDQGRKRLAAAMVERADAAFARTVFTSAHYAVEPSADVLLVMLRAVEASPVVYGAGVKVLAERSGESHGRALLEEAQRVWLERPEHRGDLLYLLGWMDRRDRGDVDWRGFEDAFGSRVSQSELAAYLEAGPYAVAFLPVVWRALGRFDRAPLVVPKLDGLLDQELEGVTRWEVLRDIVGYLCVEKRTADLAALRAYLRERVTRHPGEHYVTLEDEMESGRCRPPRPSPPARNEVRLLSSKKRLQIIQRDRAGVDL